ncbi:hypothetical protein ACR3K2_13280 [Cryptosporidium serpentis]
MLSNDALEEDKVVGDDPGDQLLINEGEIRGNNALVKGSGESLKESDLSTKFSGKNPNIFLESDNLVVLDNLGEEDDIQSNMGKRNAIPQLESDVLKDFIVEDGSSDYELDEDDIIHVEGGIRSSDEEDDNSSVANKSKFNLTTKRNSHKYNHISESDARERIRNFFESMNTAAIKDEEAYAKGRVAAHKLRMIDDVCKQIAMPKWSRWFINEGIFDVLDRWLSTLPDGTLPNLALRSKILNLLNNLPIKEDDLIGTTIGRRLCELWQNPSETQENRQIIRSLVQRWLRTLMKNNSPVDTPVPPTVSASTNKSTFAVSHSHNNESKDTSKLFGNSRTAKIPQTFGYNFKIVPQNDGSNNSIEDKIVDSTVGNLQIHRNKGRKVTKHAMRVSLEGRGM